ncbi:WD40 repeat domain-containing protein [Streptomyces sp. NBC_01515]|uniref:WD40 repeat domain-containing protein n=1 Tax=Streptomyces sp. NBC_01515 TaxID=2903890 RepID=UPI003870235D
MTGLQAALWGLPRSGIAEALRTSGYLNSGTAALAAESSAATAGERAAGRFVPALAAEPLPPRAVPGQPRLLFEKLHPAVSWVSRFLAAFVAILACLTATVTLGGLPVPGVHEGPKREAATEQWRLVDTGRLWTDLGADVLAFSPKDSRLLLTISPKGLDSWDVTEPEHPERVTPGGLGVKSRAPLGISQDGRTLVVADGEEVSGLRTDTGQRVWSISMPRNEVKALHVERSDVMLAVSDATHFTRLLSVTPGDTDGGKPTTNGQIRLGARAAQFSPDGKILATATDDGMLRLWDISSAADPRRAGPPFAAESGRTSALAFSADGRLLAAIGADHVVRLWNVGNPERPRPLGRPLAANAPVTALTFSRDPRLVATVGIDHTAYLWRRN